MAPVPPLDRPLTDGVITLRQWEVADAPTMQCIFLDPEMYRWTDAIPDEPLAEFESSIRRSWLRREAGDRIALAILDASTDEVIGAIDLMMAEFGRAELGYALGSWARSRGYATRAVRLLSRWSFDVAGVHRLELPIPVANARSRAVAERAGYHPEGVLRSYLTLRDGGERHDVLMFSLLPGDLASD
ncbi:MAG: GNAT family protein [Patulibacter minatonensis]